MKENKSFFLITFVSLIIFFFSFSEVIAQGKKEKIKEKEKVEVKPTPPATPDVPAIGVHQLETDIRILRILSLFEIKKEQIDKLIEVIEDGIKRREKNLSEIRTALLEGKKYGELRDTYLSKLNRTNARITGKIMEVLDGEEQKKAAQIVFNLITEEEMATIMQSGPGLIEMITTRIKLLQDLGVMPISEETFSLLMQPMAQIGLELVSYIQNKAKEMVLGILIQERTVELLKEMKKVKK